MISRVRKRQMVCMYRHSGSRSRPLTVCPGTHPPSLPSLHGRGSTIPRRAWAGHTRLIRHLTCRRADGLIKVLTLCSVCFVCMCVCVCVYVWVMCHRHLHPATHLDLSASVPSMPLSLSNSLSLTHLSRCCPGQLPGIGSAWVGGRMGVCDPRSSRQISIALLSLLVP